MGTSISGCVVVREPLVAGGGVCCARCQEPIERGDPWDLGHSADRTRWTGPEHRACNRATVSHNGAARKLVYLEAKVPFGIVRCGRCGWRIRKGSAWTVGGNARNTRCASSSRIRAARRSVRMGRGCGRMTGGAHRSATTSGDAGARQLSGHSRPSCGRAASTRMSAVMAFETSFRLATRICTSFPCPSET